MTSAVVSISGGKLVNVQTSKLRSQTAVREKRERKLKGKKNQHRTVFWRDEFVCHADVFAPEINLKQQKSLLLVQIS